MTARAKVIDAGKRFGQPPLEFVSSGDFVLDFVPPNYLIDGVLQRRFVYSLTAPTGGGKTAIALRIAAHVGLGQPLTGRDVEQGHVLYLAGENPDDLRMRWIAQSNVVRFDAATMPVTFVPSVFPISAQMDAVQDFAKSDEGLALVIVDTSAAYFEGNDENDNIQMTAHARSLRTLTNLEGGPAVLILCHPTKNAKKGSALQPRGGGAFLAEIDGNIIGQKAKESPLVTLSPHEKFRGVCFDPLTFRLEPTTVKDLIDSKGNQIPTVVAHPLGERDRGKGMPSNQSSLVENLKSVMERTRGLSFQNYADELGATKRQVQSAMNKLTERGIVAKGPDRRYYITNAQPASLRERGKWLRQ